MFGPAKKVFFHVGQTEKMAHALAGKFPDSGVRSVVKIASESGFSKISIENVSAAMNNDVYFIASFDTPADVIEQLGAIFTLVINGARSMNVILPFFPTATMERIEKKGEVATAKSLARMIGAIPFSADNKSLANVFFFDEHTTNLRLYFPDEVTPIPLTAIPLLLKELESIDNCEIGFPDAGAGKRFGRLIPEKFQRILGDKIRGEGDKRTVVIKEGDPAGKFVVVIDDLSRTCGTLREFCEALLNAGAAGVWVFTVHGAFNKGAWKKFVERMHEHIASGKFKKFFITDSCPIQAEEVSGHESFKVLSLVDLIYKAIS